MSDLTGKFGSFEEQIASNHTEVMNALDTIATALGAPPPTATITLADIHTQLTALLTLLGDNATRDIGYYNTSLSELGTINNNLDLIITNNSLNAQRFLIAIAANDPCKVCDVVPIEPPPLEITPQPVDQDHCKRMQALIYALRRFTVKLDVLSSFGLGFSPTVIRDAITEVITELGVTGQLEYPSLGEVAQLAGAGAAYVVSNVFGGGNLPAAFLSIEDELLPALYAADNASAGLAAYRAVLAGSALDTAIVHLFEAMGYTSIFNLYYDSSIELDLSGYDGTICTPEPGTCITMINYVLGAGANTSPIDISTYHWFDFDNSGAGPGTIQLVIDDVVAFSQTIVDGGHGTSVYTGSGSVAYIHNNSPVGTYIVARACTSDPMD